MLAWERESGSTCVALSLSISAFQLWEEFMAHLSLRQSAYCHTPHDQCPRILFRSESISLFNIEYIDV